MYVYVTLKGSLRIHIHTIKWNSVFLKVGMISLWGLSSWGPVYGGVRRAQVGNSEATDEFSTSTVISFGWHSLTGKFLMLGLSLPPSAPL